jgi:endoglucanase Acf2
MSALTSDNVEGALSSLVRDIVQGDSDSTTSGIRRSVDSFMKRASASLDRNGSGKDEKEKCTVS